MIAQRDPERRFAIAAALLLPWLMLFVTDWTVTPVGMVDAWIYRALGRDLVQANATLGEFYYAARAFVLVPRYLLTRFLLEGVAHATYGLLCAQLLLLAVLDLLTSVARPATRLPGVLLFGTCMLLLRSLGWGYIDGSLITWFLVGLAGVARWYRPGASPNARRWAALVGGGCFAAMLATHPMTVPMLLTPLGLIVWLQRKSRVTRGWLIWLELTAGGIGAVLLMAVVCQALYGRFFFFMPIINEALQISTAAWKTPNPDWLSGANWLVLVGFAWLAAAFLLATTKLRRVRLTSFEAFAWLNMVGLMSVMLLIELVTDGYWFEYPWFASYFVPSALLALAAMLGERAKGISTLPAMAALIAVFVFGSAVAFGFEASSFKSAFAGASLLIREPALWWGTISLASLQAAIALVALVGLMAWHWKTRRPGLRSTLVAASLMAVLVGSPINQMPPGDDVEAQASAVIARSIVMIQDELRGKRPVYWFDLKGPLAQIFVTLSSAHLSHSSRLRDAYPEGARVMRPTGGGTFGFFESGDPVIILDETSERFARAQQSFSDLGITLTETRRVPMELAGRTWMLIFATLEPKVLTLLPAELRTLMHAAATGTQERISEHERGYLSFGPYVRLGPGKHRVTFHLYLLDQPGGHVLGLVEAGDFTGPPGFVAATKQIFTAGALADGSIDVTLEFTLQKALSNAEFRVFTLGNSRLGLKSIELQRPDLPVQVPRLALLTPSRVGETFKSADLKTSGLFVHVVAEVLGTGRTTVRARITPGPDSPSQVELSPGDELTATVGATTHPLARQSMLGASWYEADFEGDAGGSSVKVALTRQSDGSARESTVALPVPVTLTAPAGGAEVSRTSGLTLTWSTRGEGTLHLIAKGTCIEPVEAALGSERGSYTFPAFEPSIGNALTTCNVGISVVHSMKGTGDLEAASAHSLTVSSTP